MNLEKTISIGADFFTSLLLYFFTDKTVFKSFFSLKISPEVCCVRQTSGEFILNFVSEGGLCK